MTYCNADGGKCKGRIIRGMCRRHYDRWYKANRYSTDSEFRSKERRRMRYAMREKRDRQGAET